MKEPNTPCLFGIETEYGIAVFERGTESTPVACMVREVFDSMLEAARAVPALPGYRAAGLFLANGARFYVETGLHLEYATPECPDPWTLATHVAAGERLLRAWADVAGNKLGVTARVLCHNVDATDPSISWGCHESYLVRDCLDNDTLIQHLVPHLATRIVYTGAGGTTEDGLFVLSPRATTIHTTDSYSTMHARGLLDLHRQEPWSPGGFRRLHFCCGDTNRLQTTNVLKVGTTALLLILLQNGVTPDPRLGLETPIEALQDLNIDPQLVSPVATPTDTCHALDLQRGLLEHCERHLDAPFMPPWADRLCSLWRTALGQLAAGSAGGLLDWPTKWELLKRHGLDNGSPPDTDATRQKLALNVRFAMLGGILDHLDAAGGIERAVPDADVETATRRPPSGRASVRGKAIARCAPNGLANWSQVIDLGASRTINLKNPIAPSPRWTAIDPTIVGVRYDGNAARIARTDYASGNYRAVGLQFDGDLGAIPDGLLEISFRASCEAGDSPRAVELLHHIEAQGRADSSSLALPLLLHCNAGLVPGPEALTICEESVRREHSGCGETAAEICYLKGRVLLGLGKPAQALQLLMSPCLTRALDSSLWIRATAHLGDALRRLGDRKGGINHLMRAESVAKGLDNGLHLADHVLTCLAKACADDPATAAAHLGRAADIQCRADHPFGLARTLLLEARICGNTLSPEKRDAVARQIRSLQTRVPALQTCPRVNMILDLWSLWCSGQPNADFPDLFWDI